MRAAEIVQRLIAVLNTEVHQRRLRAVCRAVSALVGGGRATLTGIGRSMEGSSAKHLIKAADRLLGNVWLQVEVLLFYVALSRHVVPRGGRPVLLIDWTDIGCLWAVLSVTLVTDGRGAVLYARAYPRRSENNPRVESLCLRTLAKLLHGAKPIIVADAGFRGPWLKQVRAAGWDFVVRVRGRVNVKLDEKSPWRDAKSLWCGATRRPTSYLNCQLAKSAAVAVRLVVFGERRRKPPPRIGRRKAKRIRAAREPWVLATSMVTSTAKQVVNLYKLRMRIEETFRDQKCPRFGWGLDQARSNDVNRINVLLMLTALAHYVALLIGLAAEACDLRRRFQANTVTTRRCLSLPRLAREALTRLPPRDLDSLLRAALRSQLEIVTHP